METRILPRELRTQRLVLRPWRADDAPRLLAVLATNVDHLTPWIPARVAEVVPLSALAKRLESFGLEFEADREWRYALITAKDEAIVGEVSLFPRAGDERVPYERADHLEIGYWLDSAVTGQGLATEAAAAMLALASDLPRMTRVEIRCDARNDASAAVPRRLGFTLAATLEESAVDPTDPPIALQIWSRALQPR